MQTNITTDELSPIIESEFTDTEHITYEYARHANDLSAQRDVFNVSINIITGHRLKDYSGQFNNINDNDWFTLEELLKLKSTKRFLSLSYSNWLDDEVVNRVSEIINNSFRSNDLPIKTFCWNSFFFQKLQEISFKTDPTIDRWVDKTKIDFFSLDCLLIPINVCNVHWLLAAVDMKHGFIFLLDSSPNSKNICMYYPYYQLIRLHLIELHKRKRPKAPMPNFRYGDDMIAYYGHCSREYKSKRLAQQQNGNDCGAYMCLSMISIALGSFQTLCDNDMYLQARLIVARLIATGKLSSVENNIVLIRYPQLRKRLEIEFREKTDLQAKEDLCLTSLEKNSDLDNDIDIIEIC